MVRRLKLRRLPPAVITGGRRVITTAVVSSLVVSSNARSVDEMVSLDSVWIDFNALTVIAAKALLCPIGIVLTREFVVEYGDVGDISMEPKFEVGEVFRMDKLYKIKNRPLVRGDIIGFSSPPSYYEHEDADPSVHKMIKRVIGVEVNSCRISSITYQCLLTNIYCAASRATRSRLGIRHSTSMMLLKTRLHT